MQFLQVHVTTRSDSDADFLLVLKSSISFKKPCRNTDVLSVSLSQVAKTLFSDEYLKPCPRCQHPARCHALRVEGQCSWSDCGFRFCTACSCAFHGSKDCAHLSAKRRSKRDVLPGSAQSKRNVRRL